MVNMNTESMEREVVADIKVEGDAQEKLVPRKEAVSVVWKYFSFESLDINQMTLAYCSLCPVNVVAACYRYAPCKKKFQSCGQNTG